VTSAWRPHPFHQTSRRPPPGRQARNPPEGSLACDKISASGHEPIDSGMHQPSIRKPQVCVLGSAEPGSAAYDLAAHAGTLLARCGITVVSGCGSPATRVAAERAVAANGLVLSIVPPDEMPAADWPATVVIPCGMGDARNLLMALAGDACIVIGGRAGTISEVCLAWLHKRPLLPLVGCGGWSESLPANPPDQRGNSRILPWRSISELEAQLRSLDLVAR
jgi:uncharacterized protein (TIGR00725 family)